MLQIMSSKPDQVPRAEQWVPWKESKERRQVVEQSRRGRRVIVEQARVQARVAGIRGSERGTKRGGAG